MLRGPNSRRPFGLARPLRHPWANCGRHALSPRRAPSRGRGSEARGPAADETGALCVRTRLLQAGVRQHSLQQGRLVSSMSIFGFRLLRVPRRLAAAAPSARRSRRRLAPNSEKAPGIGMPPSPCAGRAPHHFHSSPAPTALPSPSVSGSAQTSALTSAAWDASGPIR